MQAGESIHEQDRNDLGRQTYPAELMEIILVDDHSADQSASLVASAATKGKHLRCLDLPEGLSGKKKAIAYGVQHAEYDRIIQVDADCSLEPGFIASHMAFLAKHPSDLVAGMVTTRKEGGSFLEIFDRLDMLCRQITTFQYSIR